MKKLVSLICILIVAITVFCSCGGNFEYTTIDGDGFFPSTASPYKSKTITNQNDATFTVYVCGAVENEGYYVVKAGTTVADVVALAGILPQTIFPKNATTYIKNDCQIAVCYYENEQENYCLNVNGATVQFNLSTQNIPAEIIEKLHNYYTQKGPITSKQILRQILTEAEYQQHHYKLCILEADYETPN